MEDMTIQYQLFVKSENGKWKNWGKPGYDLDEKISIVKAMNIGATGKHTYEGRVIKIVTQTSIEWEGQ